MLFFSSLSVQSLAVVINSILSERTMVLDDKATAFLLQVRQAMAASNGSPVEAESIPLGGGGGGSRGVRRRLLLCPQRGGCGHSFQLREYIGFFLY
jgi:hypothetical protein